MSKGARVFVHPSEVGARPSILAWTSIGAPYIVELAGAADFDAIVIDCQHGVSDKSLLLQCLTAARAAKIPALARVEELSSGAIGRALDAGAQGVICPMVNTIQDAEKLVEYAKYPPLGARSYGPYRGKLHIEGDYFEAANNGTIICPQIETAESVQNLDEILPVNGIDMVLVGPNDLAISLSNGDSRDILAPRVLEAIDVILEKCQKHRKTAAIFANDMDYAQFLMKKGWQNLAISTDAAILAARFKEIVDAARSR